MQCEDLLSLTPLNRPWGIMRIKSISKRRDFCRNKSLRVPTFHLSLILFSFLQAIWSSDQPRLSLKTWETLQLTIRLSSLSTTTWGPFFFLFTAFSLLFVSYIFLLAPLFIRENATSLLRPLLNTQINAFVVGCVQLMFEMSMPCSARGGPG